ncbi:MAG: hypothetical protein HY739_12905 [Desulfobacterales bacterium]|nr:hypothetical protein [Desulfobacterales bacterium]
MVRHYLQLEPAQDIETLMSQYIEAAWIEERQMNVMAGAIAKAFGGKS